MLHFDDMFCHNNPPPCIKVTGENTSNIIIYKNISFQLLQIFEWQG